MLVAINSIISPVYEPNLVLVSRQKKKANELVVPAGMGKGPALQWGFFPFYLVPQPAPIHLPSPPALYFEVLFLCFSEETKTGLCQNGLFYYLKIEKNDN